MNTDATLPVTPNYTNGKSKITCLNRYILIQKIVHAESSKSGLALSAKDISDIRYKKAKIVSVGASVTPNTLSEGDIILYDFVGAHDIRIDNETFTLIQEKDVVVCFPH
jgi:co-chaperonin GroES (HSP10)